MQWEMGISDKDVPTVTRKKDLWIISDDLPVYNYHLRF